MMFGVHLTQLRKAIIFLVLAFPRLFLLSVAIFLFSAPRTANAAPTFSSCYAEFKRAEGKQSHEHGTPADLQNKVRIVLVDRDATGMSQYWNYSLRQYLELKYGLNNNYIDIISMRYTDAEQMEAYRPHIALILLKPTALRHSGIFEMLKNMKVKIGNVDDPREIRRPIVIRLTGRNLSPNIKKVFSQAKNTLQEALADYLANLMQNEGLIPAEPDTPETTTIH